MYPAVDNQFESMLAYTYIPVPHKVYYNSCLYNILFSIGSSLSKCTFDGQQCCNQNIITFADTEIKKALNKHVAQLFTSSEFTNIQRDVKKLKEATKGTYLLWYMHSYIHKYIAINYCS